MALRQLDDQDFSYGINRDTPSWLLQRGWLYDALNFIFDKPGIARQRGPSTAIFSGAQTAFATSIGWCYSQDGTVIEELYGLDGKGGLVNSINKTTGVATGLGVSTTANSQVQRAIRHFGYVHFPHYVVASGVRKSLVVAGQTSGTTFTNTVVAQCTANNQQITLTGADVTTNIKVGALCHILLAVGGTRDFTCRVVSIDTAKLFTVWPKPDFTDAAIGVGNLLTGPVAITPGGVCGASFQNRLLFGNTADMASVSQTLVSDRRVYYSPLITEPITVTTLTYSGTVFNNPTIWPTFNYFDVPGADAIVAMEPVNDNELLILTSTHPVIFRGNLVTQLSTTSPQITFDISEINKPYGCLSDLTVHRTPRGIIWAGPNGIYAYDGASEIVDITKGKIATLWRGLVRGTSFAIHGAAYVRGHYVISGISGGATFGLACNMDNLQWGRMSGVGTDSFVGVARPTDASQVFAARWWDQLGAAPSMTNGQVVRIESMMDGYVAGATKTDADGTAITILLTSRVLDGDAQTQKIWARCTMRYAASMPAVSVSVAGKSGVDVADTLASVTIGSLSNTLVLGISAATNATPIVCTTGATNHGLQTDDYVDIVFGTGNTHINGRWRITVVSATTFSLNGSTGNGAYAGGGQLRKVNESDFLINSLAQSQGVAFTISSSAAVNNFELHGFRVAYYERDNAPVVSA